MAISLASDTKLTLSGSGEQTWGMSLSDIAKKIDENVPDNAEITKIELKFSGKVYNNNILKAYNEYVICGLANSKSDVATSTDGGTGGTNLFKYGPHEIAGRSTVTYPSQTVDITKYFGACTPHSAQNTSYSTLAIAFTSKAVYTKDYTFSVSLDVTYKTHTHSYTSKTTDATCTTAGVKTYTCTCGDSYTETISALGHSFGTTTAAKAATCTTAGNSAYKKCSRCNLYFAGNAATNATGGKSDASSFTIPALGHSYGSTTYTWSSDGKSCTAKRVCSTNSSHTETATATITSAVKTAATCTAKGTTRYTATFNVSWASTQTKDVQDIAQKSHSYTGAIKSDGNGKDSTHSFKCVNGCNQYGGTVKHTWNSGTVTQQPTCTTSGVRTYTCTASGCGATYTETIPANGHTWIDATCTTPKTCSVCGTTEGSFGHSYASIVTPPTGISAGYTTYICTRCNHSYVDNYIYLINKIYIGTSQPSKIYLGTQEVKEVYLGTTKVYG